MVVAKPEQLVEGRGLRLRRRSFVLKRVSRHGQPLGAAEPVHVDVLGLAVEARDVLKNDICHLVDVLRVATRIDEERSGLIDAPTREEVSVRVIDQAAAAENLE